MTHPPPFLFHSHAPPQLQVKEFETLQESDEPEGDLEMRSVGYIGKDQDLDPRSTPRLTSGRPKNLFSLLTFQRTFEFQSLSLRLELLCGW